MNALFEQLGISRQAHFQNLGRMMQKDLLQSTLKEKVLQIRKDHPRIGLRKVYHMLNQPGIGRDGFEALMANEGLKLQGRRNFVRTTYPERYHRYSNLISGMEVTRINQVWVSDITYYPSGTQHYYLTFIMDVYTRKIVGWSTSNTLQTQSNMEAVRKAINQSKTSLQGLIHHSDRGTQYLSNQYIDILESNGVEISIGNKAWENAHAERINGIIKQEYLPTGLEMDLKSVQKLVNKSVELYNDKRPHWNLPGIISPGTFEQIIDKNKVNYKVKIKY